MGMISQLSGPIRRQLSAFIPPLLWAAIVLSSMVQGGQYPEPSLEVLVSGPCLHLYFITCRLCPLEIWTAMLSLFS